MKLPKTESEIPVACKRGGSERSVDRGADSSQPKRRFSKWVLVRRRTLRPNRNCREVSSADAWQGGAREGLESGKAGAIYDLLELRITSSGESVCRLVPDDFVL
jgi:hypothetical protein